MAADQEKILGRAEQAKLVIDLKVLYTCWHEQGLTVMCERIESSLYQANLGIVPDNLEEIRPLMKAILGHDPVEWDELPKGEQVPAPEGRGAREAPSLQDLRRRIYVEAKAKPAKRFWGLCAHVFKMETLREAYRLSRSNSGAPGIDGVTFEAIEEAGVEAFLKEIRDELTSGTYRPLRNRKKEIPKDGGKKVRVLSIPSIRDRVVQGALKLVLEPIFEADFQPGSFGYRPKRTAHEAVSRVAKAIVAGKTRAIDLDLRSFFDSVRHHTLLEKIAARVKDDGILRLLKMILKAAGKRGVPQGGVISPLLSNLYLNEVDRMLERAKEVTRQGTRTCLEYVRYADDLVILLGPHPRQDWLLKVVQMRLRQELAQLQVEVNDEKTRVVDLAEGDSFGFLGFEFRRVRSRRGRWRPDCSPKLAKRTELFGKLKDVFRRYRSQSASGLIRQINPILRGWVNYFRIGNSGRCFSHVRYWVEKKVRRHLMRARQWRGFGWKRWSTEWIHGELGLFNDYSVRYYTPRQKALPTGRPHNPRCEVIRKA